MAENTNIYYGSGIGVAGNIDIGAIGLPADSRLMVKTIDGLAELQAAKRVYDGMIVYVEDTHTFHKCRVDWDANKAITSCTWTEVVIKSEAELRAIITATTTAAMEFKGATGTLPATGIKGDMYKVSATFEVSADADAQGVGFTTKVGDSIVCDVVKIDDVEVIKWYHIPSGDDIEDTWRPVTGVATDASLAFVNGNKTVAAVSENGEITFNHDAIASPVNTNADGDEKVREYITSVETDGYGHITGFKTNIETVADTSYEFEGTTNDESNVSFSIQKKVDGEAEGAAEVIKLDAYTQSEVDDKVAKALADAKLDSSNKDAVVLAEAQNYTDEKIAEVNDKIDNIDYTSFKTKQEAYSAAGSDKKTVTNVIQNANGEIEVTYGDIDFTHNHDDQYKKLQSAIEAVATEKNVFVETVAQDANGVVTIGTKAVDFSEITDNYVANDDLSTKIDALVAAVKDRKDENQVAPDFESLIKLVSLNSEDIAANQSSISNILDENDGILAQAKDYADSLTHENTTYTFAPTANALEFTVTPDDNQSESAIQTIHLVAPTVDTGVMEVEAGNDIVVTPGENGKVTVAHETFVTGEYAKDPATSDKTGDQYFFTGVTVDNGHITGANVKSLASVLEAMSFIFDGGNSTT